MTAGKKSTLAKYMLSFDPSICRWCRCCELACSLHHEGTCSPALSRMRLWVNTLKLEAKASLCMQCAVPRCVDACPVEGAMIVDPKTGAKLIVESKCTACGECAKECPFNTEGTVIFLNAARGSYVKCDLCLGEPRCVKFCTTGALELRTRE
jgi:carbon-monoxide dehydrogenase iron sulfur subunit